MTDAATIVQGTAEWRELRLGKITVSKFKDVLSEPRNKGDREAGRLSESAKTYLYEVLADLATGQDQGIPPTWAMQWGIDNEPAARELYATRTGQEVQEVGFVQHPDEPMIGGSPDGLVGDDGGLEIKCPGNTANHLAYMLGGELPKEHVAQVQGHLWLNRRQWWDFVSYDPRIKGPGTLRLAHWIHRVERDEEYIRNLEKRVFAFRDLLLETIIELEIGGRLA